MIRSFPVYSKEYRRESTNYSVQGNVPAMDSIDELPI